MNKRNTWAYEGDPARDIEVVTIQPTRKGKRPETWQLGGRERETEDGREGGRIGGREEGGEAYIKIQRRVQEMRVIPGK